MANRSVRTGGGAFICIMGICHVQSGPLVRSSYHAWDQVEAANAAS